MIHQPRLRAKPDGRHARGERRRADIINATLAVITRDGAAGVTHRTVAREAKITTSLTTYHFATLDDLLIAALTTVAEDYSAAIRSIIDTAQDPLTGLAELISSSAGDGRERALAERELATMASRRPALRPLTRQWRDDVAELARTLTTDPQAVEALVVASEGLCTLVLLGNSPSDVDHLRVQLERAVNS